MSNQQDPPKKPTDPQKEKTISLVDLMNEEAQASGAPPLVIRKSDLPPDEATPTGPAGPAILPRPRPGTPTPPIPKDRTIASQPPVSDNEATRVQPKVAFPGSTDPRFSKPTPPPPPTNEAKTELFQRPPAQQRPGEAKTELFQRPSPQQSTQRPAAPPPQQPTQRSPQGRPIPPDQQQATRRAPAGTPPSASPSRPSTPKRPTLPPAGPRVVIANQTNQPKAQPQPRRNWGTCLSRVIAISLLLALVGGVVTIAGLVIGYQMIASDLPNPEELASRASTFETAILYDRDGGQLYSLADPTAGNRTYVTLDRIASDLVEATIATEDARFYTNPGFDPIGIARAIVQAAREREFVSGASTITQQLVRALLLSEDERTQRTFTRKVREIILAAEIWRTYPKDTILELYLNEIYYGNLAYGIEAASQTYFGKSAADLTLAEASLLAGLPQSPAVYDPYTAPELALGRQSQVLGLMVQENYITQADAQTAIDQSAPVVRNLTPPEVTIRYPHFVFTVLQQLENLYGSQAIYRGGWRIYTTIDPAAQRLAEETVAANRANFNNGGANNAALVALKPDSGEIVALVGSADFNDEAISGQVNMALTPRQPGSSIKPFVFLNAFEQGWTPATLIWDVPTQFPDGANPPYEPKNFDDEFHGPLLVRPSLGNSYNIPAVKALEYVGVCNFIANVQKLGLTSLQDPGCAEGGQPRNYGLALALGGGEIAPLEMATAYAILANGGRYYPPFTISRITNSQGQAIDYTPPAGGQQVITPEHAYLLTDILADNGARVAEFGQNNNLVIPNHRVAAKTGTSGSSRLDVRDGWTIGYTPQIVTAVWIGNTIPTPLAAGSSGYQLASPIWRAFMSGYLGDKPAVDFSRPAGVITVEICADSGAQPGPGCNNRRNELFASDQPPLDNGFDFFQRVPIDLWTGLVANDFCQESVFEANFVNLLVSGRDDVRSRELNSAKLWLEGSPAGQNWAQTHNIALPLTLPPAQSCNQDTPRPRAVIDQPPPNAEINGQIEIGGSASGPNFSDFVLEYGLSHDPGGWAIIAPPNATQVQNGLLASWDTTTVAYSGPLTLRLTVFGPDNPFTSEDDPVSIESRLLLSIVAPTGTPSPTPSETPTPTETPSISPTPSETATAVIIVLTPTETSTLPPIASDTPTLPPVASDTPAATPEPSETPATPYP